MVRALRHEAIAHTLPDTQTIADEALAILKESQRSIIIGQVERGMTQERIESTQAGIDRLRELADRAAALGARS